MQKATIGGCLFASLFRLKMEWLNYFLVLASLGWESTNHFFNIHFTKPDNLNHESTRIIKKIMILESSY